MIFNEKFLKTLGFTPSLVQARAEQKLRGMELQEKEGEKDKKYTGKLFRNSPQKKGVS